MLAYLLHSWLTKDIVDEFEMKVGERLPKETRMELPELSFAQELLNTPVPFENRVEALSMYVKHTERNLTSGQIAKRLGISENVAVRMAAYIDAPTSTDSKGDIHYGAHTEDVIQDELEWQDNFELLPDKLSKFQIAEHLGVSWVWVVRQAAELNVYPDVIIRKKRTYVLYPKSLVEMLRTLQLQAPLANDEYTITELEDISGKGHRWIEKVAETHGIQLLLRTNLTSHEMSYHYPASILPILALEKELLPPPAGDWLTMTAIADMLGKSRNWVMPRLVAFEELARERLTLHSKPEKHYPPTVLEALRVILEKENSDKTGWYSDAQIADLASKSIYWVRARTKKHKELARQLPIEGPNKKPTRHYPEQVMEEVVALAQQEPPEAQNRITVEEIAQMLQRKRVWVIARIGELGIESDSRLDRRMKARDHYDPEVVDMLQLHFMIDEENRES